MSWLSLIDAGRSDYAGTSDYLGDLSNQAESKKIPDFSGTFNQICRSRQQTLDVLEARAGIEPAYTALQAAA